MNEGGIEPVACERCGGSGFVDDGEITGSGGVDFENGPVKCVKDCPDCAAPQPSAKVLTDEQREAIDFCAGFIPVPRYVEILRALLADHSRDVTKLAAEQPSEDKRDAERYRWLRNPTTDVALVLDKVAGEIPADELGGGGYRIYEYRAGEDLDSAIDAAIAKPKGDANAKH